MPVIVNEIEHTSPAAQAPAGGGTGDGGGKAAGVSAQQIAQIAAALRRDGTRRARLWAD